MPALVNVMMSIIQPGFLIIIMNTKEFETQNEE